MLMLCFLTSGGRECLANMTDRERTSAARNAVFSASLLKLRSTRRRFERKELQTFAEAPHEPGQSDQRGRLEFTPSNSFGKLFLDCTRWGPFLSAWVLVALGAKVSIQGFQPECGLDQDTDCLELILLHAVLNGTRLTCSAETFGYWAPR